MTQNASGEVTFSRPLLSVRIRDRSEWLRVSARPHFGFPSQQIPHRRRHTGFRLSEKIDLDLDTFADFVVPVGLQEHARYAEVDDLTRVPVDFGHQAHAYGPRHVMAACSPGWSPWHVLSEQQNPGAARARNIGRAKSQSHHG